MGVATKLREVFNLKKDERVGSCWIEEVLPMFHDYARITNKTVYVIDKVIENNIANAFQIDATTLKAQAHIKTRKIITQNSIPVKFNKKQDIVNNDITFTKDNYEVGKYIHLKGLGYLGNLDSTLRTWIVADDYVFFKTLSKYPSVRVYSYEELKRLAPEFVD